MATPTYIPISSTTLVTAANNVTISGLDTAGAGFRDLIIVVRGQASGSTRHSVRLNGSSASNYGYAYFSANGSSQQIAAPTNQTEFLFSGFDDITTANDVTLELQIFDFLQTDRDKHVLQRGNRPSGSVSMMCGRFNSTAVVSSVSFIAGGINWSIGSTFSVYGVAA